MTWGNDASDGSDSWTDGEESRGGLWGWLGDQDMAMKLIVGLSEACSFWAWAGSWFSDTPRVNTHIVKKRTIQWMIRFLKVLLKGRRADKNLTSSSIMKKIL